MNFPYMTHREQKKAEKAQTFANLLRADTFHTDEAATKFLDALKGGDSTEREKALRAALDGFYLPFDYRKGQKFLEKNGIYGKGYKTLTDQRAKMAAGELLTHIGMMPQVIAMFEQDGDETIRDMEFEAAFSKYNITGTLEAKIIDVTTLLSDWSEYEITDRIQVSPFKQDTATYLRTQRWGDGVAVHRLDLLNNPAISLNAIITALRMEAVDNRIAQGYSLLSAAALAAEGAGQSTAFTTSAAKTLNLGRNALITANAGLGYNLSFNQPVELYSHPDHWDVIEGLFRPFMPTTSQGRVGYVVPNTFRPHFTFNLATDGGSGTGTDAVLICLPGRKNIWADFDPIRFGSNDDVKVDGSEIIGQEYFTAQCETLQFHIVDLTV